MPLRRPPLSMMPWQTTHFSVSLFRNPANLSANKVLRNETRSCPSGVGRSTWSPRARTHKMNSSLQCKVRYPFVEESQGGQEAVSPLFWKEANEHAEPPLRSPRD